MIINYLQPEARYYSQDKAALEDYDKRIEQYNDLRDQYVTDYGIYEGRVSDFNKTVEDYNTRLDAWKKQAEDYNKAIEKWNEGARTTPYEDMDYYVARPDDWTETAPQFGYSPPVAPDDPGFDQMEVDEFIEYAQDRAMRRGQAASAAQQALQSGAMGHSGLSSSGSAVNIADPSNTAGLAVGFEEGGMVPGLAFANSMRQEAALSDTLGQLPAAIGPTTQALGEDGDFGPINAMVSTMAMGEEPQAPTMSPPQKMVANRPRPAVAMTRAVGEEQGSMGGVGGLFQNQFNQLGSQMADLQGSPLRNYENYLMATYGQPKMEQMGEMVKDNVSEFVDLVDQAERAHFGAEESFGYGGGDYHNSLMNQFSSQLPQPLQQAQVTEAPQSLQGLGSLTAQLFRDGGAVSAETENRTNLTKEELQRRLKEGTLVEKLGGAATLLGENLIGGFVEDYESPGERLGAGINYALNNPVEAGASVAESLAALVKQASNPNDVEGSARAATELAMMVPAAGAAGAMATGSRLTDLIEFDPNTSRMFIGKSGAIKLKEEGNSSALDALNLAERLASEGYTDADIRLATNRYISETDPSLGGIDRNADGQFRLELSDDQFGFTDAGLSGERVPLTEGATGTDITTAYPEDMQMALRPEYEGFRDSGNIRGAHTRGAVTTYTDDPNEAKGIMLHEIQHYIQDQEGFPKGGNLDDALSGRYGPVRDNFEEALDLLERLKTSGVDHTTFDASNYLEPVSARAFDTLLRENNMSLDDAINYGQEVVEDLSDPDTENFLATELYRSLAGEVEANVTKKRADLTPAERRAMPPEQTEEELGFPRRNQILMDKEGDPFFVSDKEFASGGAVGVITQQDLTKMREKVINDYGFDPFDIAIEEGVDPDLFLRVMYTENRGKQGPRSKKGAIGLMQLMPGTAEMLGVDPFDPIDNARGGARYLKQQLEEFQSVPLALAAYNAGPGNVKKYGGVPPFEETRNYVAQIYQVAEDLIQPPVGDFYQREPGQDPVPKPQLRPEGFGTPGYVPVPPTPSEFLIQTMGSQQNTAPDPRNIPMLQDQQRPVEEEEEASASQLGDFYKDYTGFDLAQMPLRQG